MVNVDVDEYHGSRKKTKLTLFQNIIPNFLDDLAIEILSRLPHNSLFKFKSVCKTWQSLFSDPSFVKIHQNNQIETLLFHSSSNLTSLLHIKNPKTTLNLDHPFRNLASGMDLIGSINGLICLSCLPWTEPSVIWNPVINQYKYLPPPKITYIPYTMYTISLGFCYHSPTSDYIVVRIARFERGQKTMSKVELYSLNSDSWRITENEVDYLILFETCDTIVKGKPYWWACSDGHGFLVGFDICDDMLFTKVPNFRAPYNGYGSCKLTNYNSLLAVLVDSTLSLSSLTSEYLGLGNSSEREFSDRSISMFVLGGDGSWHMRLRVGFPKGIERVIGCSMNGRIVLEDKSGMIMLFDSKKEEIENITNIVGKKDRIFTVSNYAASSVPIK